MQLEIEKRDRQLSGGRLRLLQDRHGRDRDRSDAAESDRHFHHAEAARANGPIRRPRRRTELIEDIEARLAQLPGNAYEFSQPIQLRFNELLAGVRGDIAVKVFGEDFDVMLKAANQIAGDSARRSPARAM